MPSSKKTSLLMSPGLAWSSVASGMPADMQNRGASVEQISDRPHSGRGAAGRTKSVLDIEAPVEEVHQDLQMALRLHEAC